MTSILSIGEIMLELSDIGDDLFRKGYAGDTFNVAHYLSVVSNGTLKADYLTAVGEDGYSAACLDFLANHGVSTDRVLRDAHHTIGLFMLGNDERGEKQYGYWRGQAAARHMFDTPQDLTGYSYVYLSGITGAITLNREGLLNSLRHAKAEGATIVYDFNHRPKLWPVGEARTFAEQIFPLVDILKISDEEQEALYSDLTTEALTLKAPQAEWVRTCEGARAELWQNGTCNLAKQFNLVDQVVDTSAAGDSFIATYLYSKLEGFSPELCLARAHAVASQVICLKGSIVAVDVSLLPTA